MQNIILTDNFRALSLFRLAFATYLICEAIPSDFAGLYALYGEAGVLPASTLTWGGRSLEAPLLERALEAAGSQAVLMLIISAYALALGCFLIGFQTKLANAVALAIKSFLVMKNPYAASGADVLARLLLLWGLFLPLNRHWSMDAARYPHIRDRPWPLVPFLAMQLQVCSVYLFAAMVKLQGEPWRDGSAVGMALSDNIFGGTVAGNFLLEHAPSVLLAATYAVVGFQLLFPLLLFSPWKQDEARAVAVGCAAIMHLSFIACLNVAGFPFVCLAMLIALVPDAWLLQAWPIFTRLVGQAAALAAVSADRLAWARHVAGGVRLADRCSEFDGSARQTVVHSPDRLASSHLPRVGSSEVFWRTHPTERAAAYSPSTVTRLAVLLCGALAVLGLLGNILSVSKRWAGDWDTLDRVIAAAQIKQSWYLFAPVPTHYRWTYQVQASFDASDPIDAVPLLGDILVAAAPEMVRFQSHRWQKYFVSYRHFTNDQWSALGLFLCRTISSRVGGAARHVDVTISVGSATNGRPEMATTTNRTDHTFDCRALPPDGGRQRVS
jgi:hypothetical protein